MTQRINACIVVAMAIFGLATVAPAQVTDRTWGAGSNGPLPSGAHHRNAAGNWSGDNGPNPPSTLTSENAIINDTAATRNTTPPDPSQIHKVTNNQAASSV